MHPLQWGIFRLKYRHGSPLRICRSSRRSVFYGRYAADIARKVVVVAKRWRHLKSIVRKVEADPHAKFYKDEALTAVADEDSDHMELYTQNEAARVAVERERRVAGQAQGQRQWRQGPGNGRGHGANGHHGNGHDTATMLSVRPSQTSAPVAAGLTFGSMAVTEGFKDFVRGSASRLSGRLPSATCSAAPASMPTASCSPSWWTMCCT